MIIAPGVVGIDVSKSMLDVFDAATGRSERILNASAPIAALLERWRAKEVLVLFEATGSYDRPLRQALTAAAIGFARVNPARARDFARATGMLAKTDRIDARMLAAVAQALAPAAAGKGDPEREALALAHRRRDQLVHHRQQERTRRTECRDAALRADSAAHPDWLDARITHWDAEISHLLRRCERPGRIARLLRWVPGIGPVFGPG